MRGEQDNMDRHSDPFYAAKLTFGTIHEEIRSLKLISDDFRRQQNVQPFIEKDKATGELICKARVLRDVPDDIERSATRYLTEIRSTLDKAVNASARILGSVSLKHTNFPFGDKTGGRNAFEKQLMRETGIWRGIPKELRTYLMSLQPYPRSAAYEGGNDLLALLGELSNPAKHDSRLFVSLDVEGFIIKKFSGKFHFPHVGVIWNESRDECQLCRISSAAGSIQFEVPSQISFSNSMGYFDRDFSELLGEMAKLAEQIVGEIEALTLTVR